MEEILKHFPELSSEKVELLRKLSTAFREWNGRLNLVSRKDIDNFEVHHLLHSLALAKWVTFKPGMRIIDVGTGGGLPGVPLAILHPQTQFFLCDSIAKKAKAVESIVREVGLKNCTVINKRAELLESKWDFVLGRAVTNLPRFLSWIKDNIRKGQPTGIANGVLYWKGSLYKEELSAIAVEPTSVFNLVERINDPYFDEKFIIHLEANLLDKAKLPEVVIPKSPRKKKDPLSPRKS